MVNYAKIFYGGKSLFELSSAVAMLSVSMLKRDVLTAANVTALAVNSFNLTVLTVLIT